MLKENLIHGLRVICTDEMDDCYETTNEIGTVLSRYNSSTTRIEFDNDVEGHDCDGRCVYGHGLQIYDTILEPYNIYNERERI